MLKQPSLYSVGIDYQQDDAGLIQKRADIAHSAAVILEKCQLIKYERSTGRFQSTELGRIASHYYVTHNSMMTYNQHLRPTMSTLELFRVFALSNEFKLLPVCFCFFCCFFFGLFIVFFFKFRFGKRHVFFPTCFGFSPRGLIEGLWYRKNKNLRNFWNAFRYP